MQRAKLYSNVLGAFLESSAPFFGVHDYASEVCIVFFDVLPGRDSELRFPWNPSPLVMLTSFTVPMLEPRCKDNDRYK